MPGWGSGQFRRLYLAGYGLTLAEVATGNVAWCAERDDSYGAMLAPCFEQHTLPLIKALHPDAVLLAGENTWQFRPKIEIGCPESTVVPTLHYRGYNFLRPEAKQDHLRGVRDALDRIRRKKRAALISSNAMHRTQSSLATDAAKPRGSGGRLSAISPTAATETRNQVPIQPTEGFNAAAQAGVIGSCGPYRIVNKAAILRKVDNMDVDDPRRIFYDAMLKRNKYEDYYSTLGVRKVYPESFPSSPTSAKTEMQWARKRGWIADG